ncbi:hypothetical protein FZC76_20700 [Sutcliffiella horikoshii]|uniref:Uncharacterized protein n=1 Tax=Sutcliffiella horikoshii TaxID=79883 RepID=A0A5D4SJY0_9BACI|nr:hypothetical protein [Sutcliffiella horikoshii]TYS62524.1 hypothetical protein FZC76_20700 [Sutcliffiella horikoshii]
MLKKIVFLVVSLVLLLSINNTTSAFANEVIESDEPVFQELTKEQEKFVNKINKGLEKIANNPEKIKEYLLKNGFEKGEEQLIQPLHHSDVNISLERYRNSKNGLYTLIGNWEFAAGKIDTSDSSDDVVSLSLWKTDYSRPSGIVFASYPTRLYVYDSLGSLRVNTSSHFNGLSNGFIWKYADKYVYNGSGYTGQEGTAVIWATSVPSTTMYGVMNYKHTYKKIGTLDSATITGGTSGVDLSVTFSGGSTGIQNFRNQISISSWPSKYVE